MILDVIAAILILGGALLFLLAGLGLVRLPDVYSRSSSVATAAGFGITAILVGVLLELPSLSNLVKVVVAVLLQLVTSAVGSMALVRAGHLTGSALPQEQDVDSAPNRADELTGEVRQD